MARVFTTEFEFHHQKHRALVAIRNELEKASVHLRVFDPELIDILGHHSIEFAGLTGYRQLPLSHPLALPLLETINKAILGHLLK